MTTQPATWSIPTASNVREIADLAYHAHEVEQIDTDVPGLYHLAVPDGITIETLNLSEFMPTPRRPENPSPFTKLDGMLDYTTRHRDGFVELWATPNGEPAYQCPTILAILDPDQGPGQAKWRRHVARFTASETPDLHAWKRINRSAVEQLPFAEFLEDHAHTLVNPGPAHMLTVAQSIEATVNAEIKTATRLVDGARTSVCIETITAKGAQNLEIPTTFTIGLAIYEGTQPIQLTVRLRYKLQGGRIVFSPIIDRLDEALRLAFTELVDEAAATLGVTAWWR